MTLRRCTRSPLRLAKEQDLPLPATQGVSIINAGYTGSGGYTSVMRLSGTTKDIGLRTIAVVDGDTRQDALTVCARQPGLGQRCDPPARRGRH